MSTTSLLYRVPCKIARATGRFDNSGNELYGPDRPALCAVVKLNNRSEKSTVRADSSGSRGAAQEVLADIVLLFKAPNAPQLEDRITIDGMQVIVTARMPRHLVTGAIDHYQVECEKWA